jgi:hypothetical protein
VAIRERERTAAIDPVLTAEASNLDLLYKGYRMGAVDYLIKPLIPEMVRAKTAVFTQLPAAQAAERQARCCCEAQRKESDLHPLELRPPASGATKPAGAVPDHLTAQPDGRVDYSTSWFDSPASPPTRRTDPGGGRSPRRPPGLEEGWRAPERGRMFEGECRLRELAGGAFRWHLCRAVPERGGSGQTHLVARDLHRHRRPEARAGGPGEFRGLSTRC